MTEVIKEFWAVIGAGIGFIAWIVRLEARSNSNSREVVALRREIASSEARLAAQRAEDLSNRQRDWDHMNQRLDVIQGDIKQILQRTSS